MTFHSFENKWQPASISRLFSEHILTGVTIAAQLGDKRYDFVAGHDRPADTSSDENSQINNAQQLTQNTLFNVGSVTKCITGTLLAQIVTEGMVGLDDAITKYIPAYDNSTDTVRQLATHTAGYAFAQLEAWPNTDAEMADFERRVFGPREKQKKPVVEMDYWTNGYFVLMRVIEQALGADIESIAQQRLFQPLSMQHTTFASAQAKRLGRALPYAAKEGRRLTELSDAPPLGETGLWTTAADLRTFGDYVLSLKDTQPKTFSLIAEDQSVADHRRCLGYWLKPLGEKIAPFAQQMSAQAIGHPGYTGCLLAVDPTHDFVIAITSPNPKLQSNFNHYTEISTDVWTYLAAET